MTALLVGPHDFGLVQWLDLFARFLLLSQHDGLPLVPAGQETPVDVVCGIVGDGIAVLTYR